MRYPQILICDAGEQLEVELRELAARHRWMLRRVHQARALKAALRERRPSVVCLAADPSDEQSLELITLSECRTFYPDVPFLVCSPVKLPEPDRVHWSAAVLDLGARFVLFPPIIRPVLEDLVQGMMRSQFPVSHTILAGEAGANPPIDLASGEFEEP